MSEIEAESPKKRHPVRNTLIALTLAAGATVGLYYGIPRITSNGQQKPPVPTAQAPPVNEIKAPPLEPPKLPDTPGLQDPKKAEADKKAAEEAQKKAEEEAQKKSDAEKKAAEEAQKKAEADKKPEIKNVELTYSAKAPQYESKLVRALANGSVSASMALRQLQNAETPDSPELRMTSYRSIAMSDLEATAKDKGQENVMTMSELEKAMDEHNAYVSKLEKETGKKYEQLVIVAKYKNQDPESVEIKVTLQEEQSKKLQDLVKQYQPFDFDVVMTIKKYSSEKEADGKKVRVMNDEDVGKIAQRWERIYGGKSK